MVHWIRALYKLIDLSSNLYYLSKSLALPQVLVMLASGERDKQIQGTSLTKLVSFGFGERSSLRGKKEKE